MELEEERMFHSIEHAITDISKMQDVVIKLTREIHEVHVAKEHDAKLTIMKEHVNTLKTRMDSMQDSLQQLHSLAQPRYRIMPDQ